MLTTIYRIAFVITLSFALVGCGDDTTSSSVKDMAMSTGGGDMAHAVGGGDMAMSSTGDGGLAALCATCTQNSQCESGLCQLYNNGTMKCSHSCMTATAATDCPGVDACNNMSPAVCKCM